MAKKYYDQLTLFFLKIIILGTVVFDNVLKLLFSMNTFWSKWLEHLLKIILKGIERSIYIN